MGKRAPFLGVLFLIVFLPLVHAQNVSDIVGDTFEETPGAGLAIRTRPAGVKVFIDGVERGQTPFSNSTLGAGDYTVELSKDGFRNRRFTVTLSGKSRLSVSIEMEETLGQVKVVVRRAEGSPADLPLNPLIDGGSGESAADIFNLPAGLRTIRVRAFGWENTSQTVLVRDNFAVQVVVTMKPAAFNLSAARISRRRFNPGNPGGLGTTEFRFEVSAPGTGSLSVKDQSGAEVYSRALAVFGTWPQREPWNGRDHSGAPLPEGRYTITVTGVPVSGGAALSRELVLETQIDYSQSIYPLTLSGGIPGLLFAPVPSALAAGSFQIDAALFFGSFSAPENPLGEERAFSTLPFEAGLRFSPLNRLELSAAFNMNPGFSGGAGFGLSGSAKYTFPDGSGPLEMAAGVSYAWARGGGEPPLGTGRGGGLYLPMSLNIEPVRILFSPGMRWPGPDDPVPRLLLSAGALFRRAWFTAGVSLRPEFDFTSAEKRGGVSAARRIRIMYGAEIKFYPPPSNLVYTLSGGIWQRNGRAGGFGGVGIGLLY